MDLQASTTSITAEGCILHSHQSFPFTHSTSIPCALPVLWIDSDRQRDSASVLNLCCPYCCSVNGSSPLSVGTLTHLKSNGPAATISTPPGLIQTLPAIPHTFRLTSYSTYSAQTFTTDTEGQRRAFLHWDTLPPSLPRPWQSQQAPSVQHRFTERGRGANRLWDEIGQLTTLVLP